MRNYLINGLIITLATVSTAFAQPKERPLTELINWIGFLSINICHSSERYEREEINIIYHQDSVLKIHSILKSNSLIEKQVDTVFTLNPLQLFKLDKFGNDFTNKNIRSSQPVYAGTSTVYTLMLNGKLKSLENDTDYSLIIDLLDLQINR